MHIFYLLMDNHQGPPASEYYYISERVIRREVPEIAPLPTLEDTNTVSSSLENSTSSLAEFYCIEHHNPHEELIQAARFGNLNTIRTLLNATNLDINGIDSEGRTALIWATYNNHLEIVQVLLNLPSIDVNVMDNEGRTALRWAVEKKYIDIIRVLLSVLQVDPNRVILREIVNTAPPELIQALLELPELENQLANPSERILLVGMARRRQDLTHIVQTLESRHLRYQLSQPPDFYLRLRRRAIDSLMAPVQVLGFFAFMSLWALADYIEEWEPIDRANK